PHCRCRRMVGGHIPTRRPLSDERPVEASQPDQCAASLVPPAAKTAPKRTRRRPDPPPWFRFRCRAERARRTLAEPEQAEGPAEPPCGRPTPSSRRAEYMRSTRMKHAGLQDAREFVFNDASPEV